MASQRDIAKDAQQKLEKFMDAYGTLERTMDEMENDEEATQGAVKYIQEVRDAMGKVGFSKLDDLRRAIKTLYDKMR